MFLLLALAVPTVFVVLHETTHKYPYSASVTLSCAVIAALSGGYAVTWPVIAGLVLSIVGDWFMAHQTSRGNELLFGIAFFFAAHAFFCVYSIKNLCFTAVSAVFGIIVFALIGLYVFRRALPAISVRPIRMCLILYAAISALSLTLAASHQGAVLPRLLFFAGIMLIAVSDIFIAEADFLHVRSANKWICPLYYACHIAVTASVITRIIPK